MKCEKLKKYLPLYYDRALSEKLISEIDLHYLDCETCKAEIHQYIALQQLAQQAQTAQVEPPEADRFLLELQDKMSADRMVSTLTRGLKYGLAATCIIIVIGLLLLYAASKKLPPQPPQIATEEPEQIALQPQQPENLAAYMTRMANEADYEAIPNPSTPGAVAITYATDRPDIKIVWIYQ